MSPIIFFISLLTTSKVFMRFFLGGHGDFPGVAFQDV
jgi:hypothetical protein